MVEYSSRQFEFVFVRQEKDTVNQNGKITSYQEVHCVSTDVDSARAKSKLGAEYILDRVEKLGKDW